MLRIYMDFKVCRKTWCVALLGTWLCALPVLGASQVVIAGWDRFSSDGAAHAPSQRSSEQVSASLSWVGTVVNEETSSNDGTFGSYGAGAETTLIGSGISSIRWNNTTAKSITVVVSNTGPESIVLTGFHFDAFRRWLKSKGQIYELETAGDISSATFGPTLLVQQTFGVSDGDVADFQDVDIDLTGLDDRELAAGESATFTLTCTDGTNLGTIYDNLAVFGIGTVQTNFGPVFTADPYLAPDAFAGFAYEGNVSAGVFDQEGDTLIFEKITEEPSWLNVASNGVLSGTPRVDDLGTNTCTISVSDGFISSTGTVEVVVNASSNNKNVFRPNVVFILADDIGVGNIGFYHRERSGTPEVVPTPNLDRLIEGGMRFHQANTPAGLCSPTRYSVLTGNYCYRADKPWGDWVSWGDPNIQPGQVTCGSMMQDAGYRTAFFGKFGISSTWTSDGSVSAEGQPRDGLGYGAPTGIYLDRIAPDLPDVVSPKNIGFDYSCSLPAGIQALPNIFYENDWWMPLDPDSVILNNMTVSDLIDPESGLEKGPGDSHWNSKRAGDILSQKAVDFIDDSMTHHPENPFFIYYCSQAVHVPHTPPETFDGTPVEGATADPHGDMIFELDLQVGRMVQKLKDEGLYENTLFIFTSDNGGLGGGIETGTTHDSSNGLRGNKGNIYEGGHRVPFIATWPGRIATNSICTEPIMVQDLMATLYALTGQAQPAEAGLDSFNILPLLLSTPGAVGREQMMLQSGASSEQVAIRMGDWKLIIDTKKNNTDTRTSVELFDMASNPEEDESQNLINDPAQATRVAEMLAEYNRQRGSDKGTLLGNPLSRSSAAVNPSLLDTDGDGVSDADEYTAGTDAFNSSALLKIERTDVLNDGGHRFGFNTVSERVYSAYYRTNLLSGGWSLLTNGIVGDSSAAVITHRTFDSPCFYRIGVEK